MRPAVQVAAIAGTSLVVAGAAAYATTGGSAGKAGAQPGQVAASAGGQATVNWADVLAAGARHERQPLPGRGVRIATKAPHSRAKARAVDHSSRHDRAARRKQALAAADVYLNPVRQVNGVIPERVDMGADFGGSGPIYAIGDAVVTNAIGDSAGWPGGGWITYQLTDGPAKGLMVYLAEDVRPTVQVGQHVTANTVIANMFVGGDGIETGWARPDALSAESQLPEAGGVSGGGPFPTKVGLSFDALLVALGAPPAPNAGGAGYGLLPTGYLMDWTAACKAAGTICGQKP